MLSSAKQQVIWISGESWDRYGGAHRNMATALAEHARILWVDPPVSPVTVAKYRYGGARTAKPALAQVTDRVTRLTPVVLPGLSRPGIRATTPVLMRAQIRWAVRRLAFRPKAVVTAYLADLLGGWGDDVTSVLYGTDDYVAGAELMRVAAGHVRKQERRALASADVVVAITPELGQRWSGLGAKPVVIPNGCWPDGAAATSTAGTTGLARPVAALVGQFSGRIDFDVLEAIVDSGNSLLLLGPHDPRWEPERFRQLISRPSVRYTGPVPNADVPAWLADVDVGITPYLDSPFNRASFPLKTLEYLSLGLPAVATSLPASRWLRADLEQMVTPDVADQILVLADNGPRYVSAIRELAASRRGAADRRIEFARRHSWTRRAEQLAAEIGLLPAPAGTVARHETPLAMRGSLSSVNPSSGRCVHCGRARAVSRLQERTR
jgi:teichuronic acid biosynthesis glycosyltransferase TuaH